jgi:hypothetical protein
MEIRRKKLRVVSCELREGGLQAAGFKLQALFAYGLYTYIFLKALLKERKAWNTPLRLFANFAVKKMSFQKVCSSHTGTKLAARSQQLAATSLTANNSPLQKNSLILSTI